MVRLRRSAAARVLALVVVSGSVGACEQNDPVAIPNDDVTTFGTGRSFAARVRMSGDNQVVAGAQAGGTWVDRRITVSPSDLVYSELHRVVEDGRCASDIYERLFPQAQGPIARPELACGSSGAYTQQIDLCVGYAFQTLAEATTTTVVYADGRMEPESLDPDAQEEPVGQGAPIIRIPAPSTSDAATLALVATRAFQLAALDGAFVLGDPTCFSSSLTEGVPAERDDLGGWRATPTVPLSRVVSIATGDALLRLDEASRKSAELIAAAAHARRADDRSIRRAGVASWRAVHDSRLEIANVLFGVPQRLFQDGLDEIAGGLDGGLPEGAADAGVPDGDVALAAPFITPFPVCEGVALDEGDRRAEQLLRELQVDVRQPDDDVVASLRSRMQEAFPETFEDAPADPASFAAHVGIDPAKIGIAAARLREEVAALGRPMLRLNPAATMEEPRVTGTAATSFQPDPAFLMAVTSGSGNFEDGAELCPDLDYAARSVMNTRDMVAAMLARAQSRADLGAPDRELLAATHMAEREDVQQRIQVCVGSTIWNGGQPAVGSVRVRLFGLDREIDPASNGTSIHDAPDADGVYELWFGEEGLQCAVRNNIEGVPCERFRARIQTDPAMGNPTIQHAGGEAWCLGASPRYVEWNILPAHVVPLEEDGQARPLLGTSRLYLTKRVGEGPGNRVVAIAGFTVRPGDTAGDWSRCTLYPVGTELSHQLGETLAAAADHCHDPATTCAGLPRNLRLPLEDELTEAGEGRDEIESSFFHYLRVARSAADEADRLGEQLIEQGLQNDLRAEAAADRVQEICGGVLNVESLPAAAPESCVNDDGCPPGVECEAGVCLGRVTDHLSGPDVASIDSCIGHEQQLVTVALGADRLCVYQHGDDPVCHCPPGATCPACPATDLHRCTLSDPTYAGLPAGSTVYAIDGLAIVPATFSGSGVASCTGLARLRSRVRFGGAADPDVGLFNDVLNQQWLDMPTFRTVAGTLQYAEAVGRYARMTSAAGVWSLGDLQHGPTAATQFPCGPAEGLADDADTYASLCEGATPVAGRSLLCGFGNCSTAEERDGSARRMMRAVQTIAQLGAEASGLRMSLDGRPADVYWRLVGPSSTETVDATHYPAIFSEIGAGALITVAGFSTAREWSIPAQGSCVNAVNASTLSPGMRRLWNVCYGSSGEDWLENTFLPVPTAVGGGALTVHRDAVVAAWYPDPSATWVLAGLDTPTESRTIDRFLADTYVHGLGADEHQQAVSGYREPCELEARRCAWYEMMLAQRAGIGAEQTRPTVATNGDVLDALEATCLMVNSAVGDCGVDSGEIPSLTSIADLRQLQRSLQCMGQRFDRLAALLVLEDVPAHVALDIRSGTISATRHAGEYSQTVSDLRGALEQITDAAAQVGSTVRDFIFELDATLATLNLADLQNEASRLEMFSRTAETMAQCLSVPGTGTSFSLPSPVSCGSAVIQLTIAAEIARIRRDMTDIQTAQARAELGARFMARLDALDEASRGLSQGYARANGLLASLDRLRSEARRSAARASFLDRDEVGQEYPANHVMRARLNTLRDRYDRARRRAIRMAYIARRSVEQRLGVDLSRMREPMTLVPTPATWADGICTMSGINYDRLRDVDEAIDSYADGYIGDYVTLLEQFVESYRLDYPFQDGHDVAVLSLRDDIHHVRESCDVRGHNLLAASADPTVGGVWARGCNASGFCAIPTVVTLEPDGSPAGPFQTIDVAPEGAPLAANAGRALGGATAIQLQWGTPLPDSPEPPVDGPPPGISQTVHLGRGAYVLSWYERSAAGPYTSPRITPELRAETPLQDVVAWGFDADSEAPDRWRHPSWWRTNVRFENPTEQDVTIVLQPPSWPADAVVHFGAPQLELVPGHLEASNPPPLPFITTDPEGLSRGVGLCEDTDGSSFRTEPYWTRACEHVCPDGFGATCAAADTPDRSLLRCFWESRFTITLGEIERGEVVPTGALALGNFNYRIGDIAINLVGVGARDCSESPNPTACYASGFIPFSLQHAPPFRVRNHVGEVVEAPLFTGNIEQAKALVAERYITNPLSSADRALLSDYQRGELEGRPLEGSYRIRIWDAPGFDWSRVEDVQLILNYRYWTRFE